MGVSEHHGLGLQGLGQGLVSKELGTPVVPFSPFYFGVSLLRPNSREKGTLVIRGVLGNLGKGVYGFYKVWGFRV